MRVTDFSFELPESLIAHYPMPERSSCRLLSLDGPTGALTHGTFTDLLDKLNPGDLLVFNNTRVIPARLFGRKASGGKIEVLVERMLDDKRILAHIRASKAPKPGRLVSGSTWLTLKQGENKFYVRASEGLSSLKVRLIHRNAYLGV